MTRAFIVLLAALVGGCAVPPRDAERVTKTYAFVVLGEDGQAVARAITAASECPAIELDGKSEPMDIRARPTTVPQRPTRSDPALSKPAAFPVLVCDKPIPAENRPAPDSTGPLTDLHSRKLSAAVGPRRSE